MWFHRQQGRQHGSCSCSVPRGRSAGRRANFRTRLILIVLFRRAGRLLPLAFPRGDMGIVAGERKGFAPRTSRFSAAAADLFDTFRLPRLAISNMGCECMKPFSILKSHTPFLPGNYRRPSVEVCWLPHFPQPLIHARGTPRFSFRVDSVGFRTLRDRIDRGRLAGKAELRNAHCLTYLPSMPWRDKLI